MDRTYPHGVTCWIDVEQPDVDAAQEFYGGLLGWEFSVATPPDAPARYVIATLDGHDVAALAEAPRRPAAWNTYVAVDDADAAVERARCRWAPRVVSPPADAGPGGRGAALLDPAGCEIRLWQARRRKGAQLVNAPGAVELQQPARPPTSGAPSASTASCSAGASPTRGGPPRSASPATATTSRPRSTPASAPARPAAPEGFADVIGALLPAGDAGTRLVRRAHRRRPRRHCHPGPSRSAAPCSAPSTPTGRSEAVIRDPQGAVFTASQFTPPDGWG